MIITQQATHVHDACSHACTQANALTPSDLTHAHTRTAWSTQRTYTTHACTHTRQTHEIQSLAKELEYFKCVLPEKFVAGTIIAKLPPLWNDFATSLKNKRHEFSVSDLISTLDFEEKARAKDTRDRVAEGASSAHMVHEKNF